MKKIVIDRYIPYDGDPFEGIARLVPLAPSEITPEAVRDADAMVVRTRTRCDRRLLEGSSVKFIATATIGTDHFDRPYLDAAGIGTASAPGCNAPAVAQYVYASIFGAGLGQPGMRLGVVGLGHVGSIVAQWARSLGIEVLACDPPREIADHGWDASAPLQPGDSPFVTLDEIAARADVVTFHTPLTLDGPHVTRHLFDRDFLSRGSKAMVINAARGPVADNAELTRALLRGAVRHAAVDCWEGEPRISRDLLARADIATPHIAGYSIEGKRRATAAAFNALLEHFGSERRVDPGVPLQAPGSVTRADIIASYDPFADTEALRRLPDDFERLRNTYNLRHEVPAKP